MTTTTPKRKPNSIFDEQVKAINSFGIGTVYKVADMRNRMSVGKHNTERVGDYHLDLLSTKCIKRVKRGYYEVVGLIPDFLTLNMCEANRGYTTYRDNPKYLGKTDKYGMHWECYSEWYVNGEKPRIECERGKKWKLGDPNPNFDYWKTFEENNKLIEKILAESKAKNSIDLNQINNVGSIAQREAADEIISLILNGKVVEARHTNQLTVFIIISIVGHEARVKYINGPETWVPLCNIFDVKVKEPITPQPNKKEQIVNILKQGLSASDAADLILQIK